MWWSYINQFRKKETKVSINVCDKNKQHPPMFITINKPQVTAQEVEIKVR
ncbi:TPA: exotoxin beta-grasp domain-containing protein, partial [Streptococcus pyogenes]